MSQATWHQAGWESKSNCQLWCTATLYCMSHCTSNVAVRLCCSRKNKQQWAVQININSNCRFSRKSFFQGLKHKGIAKTHREKFNTSSSFMEIETADVLLPLSWQQQVLVLAQRSRSGEGGGQRETRACRSHKLEPCRQQQWGMEPAAKRKVITKSRGDEWCWRSAVREITSPEVWAATGGDWAANTSPAEVLEKQELWDSFCEAPQCTAMVHGCFVQPGTRTERKEQTNKPVPMLQSPNHKTSLCPTTKPHVLLSCTSAAKPCSVQLFWELEQKAEPYLLATKINTSAIVHEGFPAGERLCCLCTCCGFPYMWKEFAGWLQGIGYLAEPPQRNEIFKARLGFMGGSVQKNVCARHIQAHWFMPQIYS